MPDLTGTYTKDGAAQQARTRAEAVQLKFDGWRRVPDPAPRRERPTVQARQQVADAHPDGEPPVPAVTDEGDAS